MNPSDGTLSRPGESSEPLVDVHAHFVTPWYVEAAIEAGHARPDGMPGWPSWSAEDHLRLMDEHGIDRAVLSISSPGVHFGDDGEAAEMARRVNDHAAQVCEEHPDRFGFFASVSLPDVEASIEEAARALDDLGASGVVVETNVHGRYLSDPEFEAFFAELDRRAAVLFIHPTSPPAAEQTALGFPRPMLEFLVDSTRSLTGMIMSGTLTRHDRVQPIVSHCGAFLPLLADRLAMFAGAFFPDGPDADQIEAVLHRLWFDMAGTPVPTHADTLIGKVGAGHLLYGSDYCWTPPPVVAGQIAALDSLWRYDVHGPWRELVATNAAELFTAVPAVPR